MKIITAHLTAVFFLSFTVVGCGADKSGAGSNSDNKKVDVLFVGQAEQSSGFKNATSAARTHYELMRRGRVARNQGRYDEAINMFTEAISSAEFKYEKSVVYLNLADTYYLKGDLKNEMKFRLLDIEFSSNQIENQKSIERIEEIRNLLGLENSKPS